MMLYEAESFEYAAARNGCHNMLVSMLASGNHYWTLAAARNHAEHLGMNRSDVKRGIGDTL